MTGAYTRFACIQETTRDILHHLFYLSLDDQKALKPLYTGLRQGHHQLESFIGSQNRQYHLSTNKLAIVRYLDDADQRIQDYVSAKERLIALLEEERQAVIQQAVTRGLDPQRETEALRCGVAGRRAGTLGDIDPTGTDSVRSQRESGGDQRRRGLEGHPLREIWRPLHYPQVLRTTKPGRFHIRGKNWTSTSWSSEGEMYCFQHLEKQQRKSGSPR